MSDLVKLNSPELEALRAESVGVIEKLSALPDNPQLLNACLTFVHDKIGTIEEKRLSITKPLTTAKTATDAHFRELRKPFEDAKDYLKGRLSAIEQERIAALPVSVIARTEGLEGDPVFGLGPLPQKHRARQPLHDGEPAPGEPVADAGVDGARHEQAKDASGD